MFEKTVSIDALRSLPRFLGVSNKAFEWLLSRMKRRKMLKRDFLFREGDLCQNFHLIERGSIKVVKTLESGRELILGIFQAGEAVGEVALIDKSEYPASAMAHEDSSVLELSASDYFIMMKEFSEISFSTIRDLNMRVRAFHQRMNELGSGAVETRLAAVLKALSKDAKQTPQGIRLSIHLSRQELADMIGVRIETVIRIMSRWNKEGIVLTEDHSFIIPNLAALDGILAEER